VYLTHSGNRAQVVALRGREVKKLLGDLIGVGQAERVVLGLDRCAGCNGMVLSAYSRLQTMRCECCNSLPRNSGRTAKQPYLEIVALPCCEVEEILLSDSSFSTADRRAQSRLPRWTAPLVRRQVRTKSTHHQVVDGPCQGQWK
jgi:hypothetical protein